MNYSENEHNNSLIKKAKNNAITGLLLFIINTLIALVLNPILVNYLGTTYFGIWKSIDKFLGFASMADGRGTQSLKWTIAHRAASKDYNEKQRSIGSALITWMFFLPILILIVYYLVVFTPLYINNLKPEDYHMVSIVVLLLGVNLILTPLFTIPESILVGTNHGSLANYIKMIWLILGAFFTYLIVYLGYGIEELAFSMIVITILKGFHSFIYTKRTVDWIGIKKPKKKELVKFFKFSSWKTLWTFVAKFLLSSEIILFSILLTPVVVSKYIFTSYIAITGISIAAIVTSALSPGLGRMIGNEQYVESIKTIKILRESLLAFALIISFSALLLNRSFVSLWVGSDLYMGNDINFLIILTMLQLILIRNEAFLIDLGLQIKYKVLLGLFSVLLSLLFAFIGYKFIDESVEIILLGLIFGRMPLLLIYPFITNKMVRYKVGNIVSIKKIMHITLIYLFIIIIAEEQLFHSWWELIIFGCLQITLIIIYIYYFFITKDTRIILKEKILKI